jgi:hypothetical protein
MLTGKRVARSSTALAAVAILAGLALHAAPAGAQSAQMDERWTAWLGCWAPTAPQPGMVAPDRGARMVCVIPAPGTTGVEVATLVDGKVAERTLLEATGERREGVREGCSGWESAEWSADGRRLYRRAEYTCAAGVKHRSSGVMSILPGGEWLDVQGVASAGAGGVRVVHYHGVSDPGDVELRAEVARAVEGRGLSLSAARMHAAAPLATADVIEAARHLDEPVAQAWLVERKQGFDLDGKRLSELADARVPSSVIDVMVALSYPSKFAIDLATREGELRPSDAPRASGSVPQSFPGALVPVGLDWYPFGYYGWNSYAPYRYGYSPYGYSPYGYYSWYRADRPVVVVVRPQPTDQPARSHGRLVKGRGYTNSGGSDSRAAPRTQTTSGGSSAAPRGSGSQSSGAGSSAGSSSSGTSTGRTAKPREP